MRIELEIGKSTASLHKAQVKTGNNINRTICIDFLTNDELESLELDFINITKQLYDYRKQQEQK